MGPWPSQDRVLIFKHKPPEPEFMGSKPIGPVFRKITICGNYLIPHLATLNMSSLFLIVLTVLWAFESLTQSPAATKLKSGIWLNSFADAFTNEEQDSNNMYVVNKNDKVQTILKKSLPKQISLPYIFVQY
jgi:hypothetical protein